MKKFRQFALISALSILFQGCYTSTNLSTLNVEVLLPGKLDFTKDYKKAAVRYNNCNVSYNPVFSAYYEDDRQITDTTNTDSVASEIYYQAFLKHIRFQQSFDTVFELSPKYFSEINLSNILIDSVLRNNKSADSATLENINTDVIRFARMTDSLLPENDAKIKEQLIDPWFCLYSAIDLQEIIDSTGAGLLISLDFFGSEDGIFSTGYQTKEPDTSKVTKKDFNNYHDAIEVVHILSAWNFYDLKKQKLIYSHQKTDTVKWYEPAYNLKDARRILPPRWDAVMNAADVAGSQFSEYLVPHWLEVERDYYNFGQKKLRDANKLIRQNKWLEAASVFRKNVNNRNRKIASKCMFNLALICELNGEFDAATDWLSKSIIANHKDPYHKGNCNTYAAVLEWRKQEIKKIEN